jgi:hypothetical protein
MDMRFPQDLLRFLYWIYFKPFSLYEKIRQIDPTIANVSHVLARFHARPGRAFRMLVLFYILIAPWILGGVTAAGLSLSGAEVNWLRLAFLLFMALALSLSFSVPFCIAFLLPFSVTAAIWNSLGMGSALGIFFSLNLGLAYGLTADSGRWGLTAGFVYGAVFSLVLGPLHGLVIGAAFLTGYFRIVFYILEAPLSWILGRLAQRGDALRLWQFHPVLWDELIWFPLPGLDKHLVALKKQNGPLAQEAILHVQESFRQRWAAERIAEKESYNVQVANKDLKGE